MSKKQVYVAFDDGQYRLFRSYEAITVDDSSTTHFHVRCINPARSLYFNKGHVKFIDVGDVPDFPEEETE